MNTSDLHVGLSDSNGMLNLVCLIICVIEWHYKSNVCYSNVVCLYPIDLDFILAQDCRSYWWHQKAIWQNSCDYLLTY